MIVWTHTVVAGRTRDTHPSEKVASVNRWQEHAGLTWRDPDTAPLDGTPVLIRGEDFPHRPGYFMSGKARWDRTHVTHPFPGVIVSWMTDDGCYGFHCAGWHPLLEP